MLRIEPGILEHRQQQCYPHCYHAAQPASINMIAKTTQYTEIPAIQMLSGLTCATDQSNSIINLYKLENHKKDTMARADVVSK